MESPISNFEAVQEQEDLNGDQSKIIAILVSCSGAVSVCACLVLIVLYTWFREYKRFHLRLIYVQTWIDLLLSITYIVGANSRLALITHSDDGALICDFQGGILQLLALSSILWTGAIAHTLLLVLGYKDDLVRRFEVAYHLLVWGVSLTSVLILALVNGFGDAGLWCWISGRTSAAWFRFGLYYLPSFLLLFWNITCYALAASRLRQEARGSVASHMSQTYVAGTPRMANIRIITSFGTFVFVYVLVWVIGFSNRLLHAIHPQKVVFWLYCAQAIAEPSLGFLNVLAYGITEEVFKKAKLLVRGYFRRLRAGMHSADGQAVMDHKHQNIQSSSSEALNLSRANSRAINPSALESTHIIKPLSGHKSDEWYNSFVSEYDRPPSPTRLNLGSSDDTPYMMNSLLLQPPPQLSTSHQSVRYNTFDMDPDSIAASF